MRIGAIFQMVKIDLLTVILGVKGNGGYMKLFLFVPSVNIASAWQIFKILYKTVEPILSHCITGFWLVLRPTKSSIEYVSDIFIPPGLNHWQFAT